MSERTYFPAENQVGVLDKSKRLLLKFKQALEIVQEQEGDSSADSDLSELTTQITECVEGLNSLKEVAVVYTDSADGENPGRKTIYLKNHDNICGYDVSGQGAYNLIMLSKWGKVDIGAAAKQMNLNSSGRVQVNDEEEVAYVSDLSKLETRITALEGKGG